MINGFPSFSIKERALAWSQLEKTSYDLLIIGGGITGAGIARDAASRGIKTLLVERKDFAWGTSSRSSKLIHGGVRYLEQFEFKLVRESTQERAKLWNLAPQLVSPLAFLFPAYKKSRVPLWQLNIGLWMYDTLAGFKVPELHKKFSAKELKELEPKLNQKGLSGAIHYFDGATDDARLTLANVMDAHTLGATTLSRVECLGVEWNKKVPESGMAHHSVELEDKLSGEKKKVSARVVISAAGPWTDELLTTLGKAKKKLLRPTRGSHIVVKHEKLPLRHAVVMTHPDDGRVLFAIPWGEYSVLGTTDLDDSNSPDQTQMTSEEVDYLRESAKSYFPDCPLVRDDVVSTWTGLRPLIAPPEDGSSASSVSREHFLDFADPGLLLIAGGKLTTYRQMAEDCVEKIIQETQKWKLPVGNVAGPTKTNERGIPTLYDPQAKDSFLGKSEAARLNLEDVANLIQTQMILSLEDFMVRRTSLYYKEEQNGWKLVPLLKETFQKALGWDESKWESEVQGYKQYLEHNIGAPLGRSFD